MTTIGSFNAASATRIARAVRDIERLPGGGVRRRGKFDDYTADALQFTVSAGSDNATVAGGDSYWWLVSAGGLGGYQWSRTVISDTAFDYPATGYRAIYLLLAREDRAIYLTSTALTYADENTAAQATLNAAYAASYKNYVKIIAVIGSDKSAVQLYAGGPIYTRDDPPILSVQPWFPSIDAFAPSDPPEGWEYLGLGNWKTLVTAYSSGGQTMETWFQHQHTVEGAELGSQTIYTTNESLGSAMTMAFIRKL